MISAQIIYDRISANSIVFLFFYTSNTVTKNPAHFCPSQGIYTNNFYDGTGDYTVDINSFDDSTYIDYTMTSSAGVESDVSIDVINEDIDIEGVGNYTFTQYENYVISPTENDLKNLMVAITVHHASDPNTSALFSDNGSGDTFDPIPTKFWGKCKTCFDVTGGMAGSGCFVRNLVSHSCFWIEGDAELKMGRQVPCGSSCGDL